MAGTFAPEDSRDMARNLRRRASLLIAAAVLAAKASAQEPSVPPPPSGEKSDAGPEVHELLPGIGKIGAEVAVFAGASWNPFEVGRGAEAAGYINLPLARAPGGKLSYEIFLGVSWATSDPFTLTTVPVRQSVRTRLRVLHASPFGLKYALTRWDHARLRPFVNAGADVLVSVADTELEGVPPAADEASGRGLPTGQAKIALGGHGAAGVEIRLSRGLSLNLEYRFTATEGKNGRLHTASSALGFHW